MVNLEKSASFGGESARQSQGVTAALVSSFELDAVTEFGLSFLSIVEVGFGFLGLRRGAVRSDFPVHGGLLKRQRRRSGRKVLGQGKSLTKGALLKLLLVGGERRGCTTKPRALKDHTTCVE